MKNDSKNALRELNELSESLQLKFEEQDWGIINADWRRLVEFVNFYEACPGLSEAQRFELAELILASVNEMLVDGTEVVPLGVKLFLLGNRSAFEVQLTYWRGLDDSEEFPIADWLRLNVPLRQS